MSVLQDIQRRMERVGITPKMMDLASEWELLVASEAEGRLDVPLLQIIEDRLVMAEDVQQGSGPFLEPMPGCGVDDGTTPMMLTTGGEVWVTFQPGRHNSVTHAALVGQSGSGKSCLQAVMASHLAPEAYTLLIDSNGGFQAMAPMLRDHTFVSADQLHINLWQLPPGIDARVGDQVIHEEIARSYSIQFGQRELDEILAYLRWKGMTPTLPMVIHALKTKQYERFSNRPRYRDSVLLNLQALRNASGDLFECEQGFDISRLLAGNTVLETGCLIPRHQAFLTRYLFEYIGLMVRGKKRLDKELVVFLDEGQLLAREQDFASKLLTLRHRGVHLVVNAQNASFLPPELMGNCDLVVSFQATDARDRAAVSRAMILSREQEQALSCFEKGECVVSLPGASWKKPIRGRVPTVRFESDGKDEIARRTRVFLSSFTWTPIPNAASPPGGGKKAGKAKGESTDGRGLEPPAEAFLRDVLNQAHEFSALRERFERAGVRSASKQNVILKKMLAEGWIVIHELPIGRGRPVKLSEPTGKAFKQFGVSWRKTRGNLPTRAATDLLFRKVQGLAGWTVLPEGDLAGKQVDLLCRHESGGVVTVEIAGSPGHEVHNALHCLRQGEVIKHVVVATTKLVLAEVARSVARHDELAGDGRLEMLALTQALSKRWCP